MLTLYRGTFIIKQAYSMIQWATIGSDLLILHLGHMTAEQLFSSLAQIISSSSAVVVGSATQFLTAFATKRTTAQNIVALRGVDKQQMSVIQNKMDASNDRKGGYVRFMHTVRNCKL